MTTSRVNDAQTKRLRANLRRRHDPCHACGGDIDYAAHHLDPQAFQMDHLWPIALGGPVYDPANVASAHRRCNRARSDTIDDIAIAAAATYGVTLTPTTRRKTGHAPDGQPCPACADGIHNPQPGVTFITGRNWWTTKTGV
ncbi:HNH endonuclease [Mycobacterium malmoense]|uniref:HNH endonuclease n=1 Tax=Mycobacterium malmoense TaxID=1780 RepID=UPI0009F2DB12|nr:HNH endonuclease [Mycobacterium malmoense]